MLNYLKDQIEIFKFYYEIRKIDNRFEKEYREAEKEGKEFEELEILGSVWSSESRPIELRIKNILSHKLVRKANKLNVPLPDYEDERWEGTHKERLSDKGRFEVNKAVRQEIKDRREMWIPAITVITGLIGALIGLIAVLKD